LKALENFFDKLRPLFEKGGKLERFHAAFEAGETFLLTPPWVTQTGPHIRDPLDLKRVMIVVVVALIPCTLFGIYNAGYQALRAAGAEATLVHSFVTGLPMVLPIIIVSYTVGGILEAAFAFVRRHEINEGFLVTGILFPLTLPPTIPLWMVALGVAFGVVVGKEIFGGTGMNILNPALTGRAFVFFAYPAYISGDTCWIGMPGDPSSLVDGFSGATPLLVSHGAAIGTHAVDALKATTYGDFSWLNMFLGFIPGSIGETSTLCCLIGAAVLILTGIGSWQVMAAVTIGMAVTATLLNLIAGPASSAFLTLPAHYHFVMGGFAFGTVFMATDPVSCATTATGKWIYGACIGVLVTLIRTVNPAYPEGMMLAILFMNIFAPFIDHYVIKANMRRRELRYA